MNIWKVILAVVLVLVAVSIAVSILQAVFGLLISVVIPLAVVAGIGYLIYLAFRPKSIGGSGRSLR